MNDVKNPLAEKRSNWIDFAKFLGILFVLMNHADLRISVISRIGGLFYVPIFFVIAGLTYHHREEPLMCFVKRKAKRLLVPYFGYNLFLFLFFLCKDYLLKGRFTWEALRPLGGILYSRNFVSVLHMQETDSQFTVLNSPTWFLTALFLSLVLFEVCVRAVKCNWKQLCVLNILLMAIGVTLHYTIPFFLPWSIDTVLIFEILIGAGFALQNHSKYFGRITKRKFIITSAILMLFIVTFARMNGSMNVSIGDFGKVVSMGIVLAISSSVWILVLCYLIRNRLPLGATLIGEHSLSIMCLHMFVFMFVKTGFNLLLPGLLELDNVWAIAAKASMVVVTLAGITLGEIWWQSMRRGHHE